jgi:ATP-dependent RNA helicase DeaD
MPNSYSSENVKGNIRQQEATHKAVNTFIPTSFAEMGLNENTLKSVLMKGFETPTPIQVQSIPLVLEGYDLLAQAQTGTGKTAAFALPVLSKMSPEIKGIQVVVMAPTRELAQQVAIEFEQLGKCQDVRVATIVGGKSYMQQRQQLKTASVMVATPGRLHDLLRTSSIANFNPKVIILDEADRMLDMGFSEDLEAIMQFLPEDRQTLLFSATFPRSIMQLSKKMQKLDRKIIQIENKRETSDNIEQVYMVMKQEDREEALFRWIDYEQPQKTILFCEMKKDADHVGAVLARRGYLVRILHGDTEQRRREDIMRAFRSDRKSFLVATDIAARGLDVLDVTHVINFHLPRHTESYVHRVGRTGRAGQSGKAVSLVIPRDLRNIERIANVTKAQIQRIKIPTLSALRGKAIESLMEQIEEVPLDENIESSLNAYLQSHDLENLTKKLIQMHLGERFFTGIESIELPERREKPKSQMYDAPRGGLRDRKNKYPRRGEGGDTKSKSAGEAYPKRERSGGDRPVPSERYEARRQQRKELEDLWATPKETGSKETSPKRGSYQKKTTTTTHRDYGTEGKSESQQDRGYMRRSNFKTRKKD